METIDLTQTLPAGTSSMLSAGGILMLSAIIVLVVVIMKRWKARVMPGILGVIAYAVFVFIFANLATSALALIPSIDNIFYNNPATYNIVYALFATAGFTAARVVTGYMLNERFERQRRCLPCGNRSFNRRQPFIRYDSDFLHYVVYRNPGRTGTGYAGAAGGGRGDNNL